MTLIAVHRLLILSFVALAVTFGVKSFLQYRESGASGPLWGAVFAGLVGILGVVYLFRAPYLRRR